MLRGNSPTTIDSKGRLKIPTGFRRFIEDKFGPEFFVTSVNGDGVLLYPFPIWLAMEETIAAKPKFHRSLSRLRDAFSYYGTEARMDRQGRLVIPPLLRESADMSGEVAVLGKGDHLAVWNNLRFLDRLNKNRLSEEDLQALSDLGI